MIKQGQVGVLNGMNFFPNSSDNSGASSGIEIHWKMIKKSSISMEIEVDFILIHP